jgi:hypothetical protein
MSNFTNIGLGVASSRTGAVTGLRKIFAFFLRGTRTPHQVLDPNISYDRHDFTQGRAFWGFHQRGKPQGSNFLTSYFEAGTAISRLKVFPHITSPIEPISAQDSSKCATWQTCTEPTKYSLRDRLRSHICKEVPQGQKSAKLNGE